MMKHDDILTMPVDELQKRVAKVREHADVIAELLPGLVGLTPDARAHASKYRVGEPQALSSVLDAADKKPALFEGLAALDDGFDPKKFETSLLRDRLARAEILSELSAAIDGLTQGIDDTLLHLGDLSRPVMLAAYDIAKSHAKHDGSIAGLIRAALDFYARIGRAGAATRRNNKKT